MPISTHDSARVCGTRTKYVHDKCKCDACRKANSRNEAWRTRQRAYGRTAYVDAEPVRAHLRALAAQGMGWKTAAARAGLSPSTVSNLLYGNCRQGRGPTQQVRRRTAVALLNVTATLDDLADVALVPATGTQRRLRALVAIGWSQPNLADRLGMKLTNLNRIVLHSDQVTARTARAVIALYAQLWDTRPAEHDRATRYSAARARNQARAAGWAPPMAWDDELIDDPAASPDLGGTGRRALDLGEVEHLAAGGVAVDEIARRLGVTVGAIDRARYRAQQRVAS